MKWERIEKYDKRKKPIVDLWSRGERLSDYQYESAGKNDYFFSPVYGGRCCVRDATHFLIVIPPYEVKDE